MVECCATASTTYQPKREPGFLRENWRLFCAKPHITFTSWAWCASWIDSDRVQRVVFLVELIAGQTWQDEGKRGIAAGKQLWQPSWAAVWPKYSQHQVVPSHLPKCWLLCHFLQAVCNQLKQFLWLSSWHVISLQGRYYESYLIFGLIINPFLFNPEECFWPVLKLGWMLNHTKAQWLWHNVHPWATIIWFLGTLSKTT